MNKKNPILTGTLLLTAAGFISKIIGFFYRIYLSRMLGSEGMGIYHLIFPVFGVCFSLCSGGMQTAVSKFIAAEMAYEHKKNAHKYLFCGTLISMALAFCCSAILFNFSDLIAVNILHEARCGRLLEVLALCIPLSAIHSCIHGYYYGLHKAGVPAFSQLAEQAVRVISVMCMVSVTASHNQSVSTLHSVYGLVAGEAAATLFTITAFGIDRAKRNRNDPGCTFSTVKIFKDIINLFIPLTSTKLIISLLQSLESIFIPVMLCYSGLDRKTALSIYGVLTGMALPFILFPTSITNSMAVMVLPSISQASAADNSSKISRTAEATISISLYMGFLFSGMFLFFGRSIGSIIFADETAGSFIVTLAWLCPFLYASTTMASTINGLGKSKISFFNTAISLTLRIAFIVLLIPEYGIKAYLYGILASEMMLSLLHYMCIRKNAGFTINPVRHLIKPMAAMGAGILTTHVFYQGIGNIPLPSVVKLAMAAIWFGLFYLFTAYALNLKFIFNHSHQ